MEEEIKDDQVEIKPKVTKRKKRKSETASKRTSASKQEMPKVRTRKTNKQKLSSTKKKKTIVEDINDSDNTIQVQNTVSIDVPEIKTMETHTSETANQADEYIDGIQPTGQAEYFDLEAAEGANDLNNIDDVNSIINKSQEKTETTVSDNIPAEPIFFISNKVEATQNEVLPFAAIKIRNIVGKVIDLTAEIIPNKVIIQGVVHDQVFFVGNDGIVHHVAGNVHFSTLLDVPGIQPGMNAGVSAIVEDIHSQLAPDGLSIQKKLVLEIFVKVTETVQLNIEFGTGPAIVLDRVVGENSAQTLVESALTLFTPAIKIDEIVGSIRDITVETITDKVIVQGVLHKQIFFIDNANTGRHQSEDVPFSLFVDLPGAAAGMDVQVQPNIEAIFYHLISDTVLSQKAMIEFFVKVTESIIQPVTIGVGPLLKVAELIGENTNQELIETLVTLDIPAVKIREIVAAVQNVVSFVIPNKVIIQGILHKQIYFIGTDSIEHHQAEDVPFSLFLDIPGATPGNKVKLTTSIEAVFFDLISSSELRQKVIIAVSGVVSEEMQLNLVVGTGPLFKVEQVIAENTKQLLVVSTENIVPPSPPPIPVVTSVIVDPPVGTIIGSQQILLQNTFALPVTAIKIKEVDPVISDESFQVVADGVLVTGVVNKTIVFVGTDNIVRSIEERVPFSVLVNIPGIASTQITSSNAVVEDIVFTLNDAGDAVSQTLVLKAEVNGQVVNGQSINAVIDVTGPGVSATRVLMQGLIRTAKGDVFQTIEVVTDVSGPGIIGVTREQTDLLQIVGSPVTPVTIVTGVQIANP
jgi:hypothetical protein